MAVIEDGTYSHFTTEKVYPEVFEVLRKRLANDNEGFARFEHLAIVDRLLDCVHSKDGNPMFWWHSGGRSSDGSPASYIQAIDTIDIFGTELRQAVAQYINTPEVHTPYLDWWCANTLTFTEIGAFSHSVVTNLQGVFAYVGATQGLKWVAASYLWRTLKFLLLWGGWLFVALLISQSFGSVAVGTWVAATAALQVYRLRARMKIAKLFAQMHVVYRSLSTQTFSWRVLGRELEDARKLGAVWPSELWKLVEIRGGLS